MRLICSILGIVGPLAIVFALVAAPSSGVAQTDELKSTQEIPASIEKNSSERLDKFFLDLKRESDPRPAKRIADNIWSEWHKSGSPTADQLMAWANQAMQDKRLFLALDMLDQVTVLMPDFAEGWNRRATLHFIMNNHSKSMSDINRVLALEPRHFGALMGMGSILTQAGRDKAALRAYIKVLEIYPAMREAQSKVGDLTEELSGDEI